ICPSAPYNSHEEALIIAKRLNEFGEKCRPYGIKTGFHNHADDYFIENGKAIADTIYDNTNPETVIIQLDIGHAVGGGVDPFDYLERYKGRIESIHIKENKGSLVLDKPTSFYNKNPKWNFTIDENGKKVFEKAFYENKKIHEKMAVAMGKSDIDWIKIIELAKEQYPEVTCIIEREVSYNEPKDRLTCIQEDLDYIKALGIK
ncbi:MAG: TIM barrel protein, partial [Clostridia bacterium]